MISFMSFLKMSTVTNTNTGVISINLDINHTIILIAYSYNWGGLNCIISTDNTTGYQIHVYRLDNNQLMKDTRVNVSFIYYNK